MTSARTRSAGRMWLALTLLAVMATGRPMRALPGAPPVVVVVQKVANSLGLYDSATGRLIWTAAVGVRPHELVLSAGERYAYVTDYGVGTYTDPAEGGHTVSIVDLQKGERVGVVDLGRFRRPHGIALGFSGRVYVTVDHPAAVLDMASRREVARLAIGAAAEGLTIDTRSGFGYASAQGANRMVKFSLTDWQPVLEIATGASPDPMEVFQMPVTP